MAFSISSVPEPAATAGAAQAQAMRAELERTVEELSARRAAPAVAAGSGTLEMLKAIGYIGDDE